MIFFYFSNQFVLSFWSYTSCYNFFLRNEIFCLFVSLTFVMHQVLMQSFKGRFYTRRTCELFAADLPFPHCWSHFQYYRGYDEIRNLINCEFTAQERDPFTFPLVFGHSSQWFLMVFLWMRELIRWGRSLYMGYHCNVKKERIQDGPWECFNPWAYNIENISHADLRCQWDHMSH